MEDSLFKSDHPKNYRNYSHRSKKMRGGASRVRRDSFSRTQTRPSQDDEGNTRDGTLVLFTRQDSVRKFFTWDEYQIHVMEQYWRENLLFMEEN